jgi:NodT family efflux transporter outer membrane factor (OMF) lipoprotein
MSRLSIHCARFNGLAVTDKITVARRWASRGSIALAMLIAGCSVGPDYVTPVVATGERYKEVDGWIPATPSSPSLSDTWWEIYQDPALDRLMTRLNENNLSIEQAQAQYRQAISLVRSADAALYPTLGLTGDVTRADVPVVVPGSSAVVGGAAPYTEYASGLGLSWEVDLWGSIARNIEAQSASAQASAGDLAGARLSAQAALATTYLQLRVLDVQSDLLTRTVAAYDRSYQVTVRLQQAGLVDKTDVAVSRTQLESARVQQLDLQWQRSQLENAIAVLLGQVPSSFALEPVAEMTIRPPAIPVGVPSSLLQRRPDIASAERRTAAANAQIGVATAAWFPNLSISANAGYQSRQFSQWLTAPAQFWALGPALALTLFDGGRRAAQIEQARAGFDAQAAAYRLTVLRALQEVEDALVQLSVLAQTQKVQRRAVMAADESLRMTRNQYKQGLVDYVTVALLETTALNNQRNEIAIMGNRLSASVRLVAALGGGWSTEQLPNPSDTVSARRQSP